MSNRRSGPRVFALEEAHRLLPTIRTLTEEAVEAADRLAEELRGQPGDERAQVRLNAELSNVVRGWMTRIQELGLEPKGLWLVDFDNGQGYYCWRYPEDAITHYHSYDEGFAGRIKIT